MPSHTLRSITDQPTAAVRTSPILNGHKPKLRPVAIFPSGFSERHIASGNAATLAALPFRDASAIWLDSRSGVLKGSTSRGYAGHLVALNRFFGDMKVRSIHIGHLLAYQQARTTNEGNRWSKAAGPSFVNHELSALQQVMKRAKVWGQIGELYAALPLPAIKKKKVLSDLEERRLYAVAATRREWHLALQVARLTMNTTAAGTELRHLRRQDVILDSGQPRIVICGDTAKNQYRGRVIALNETATAAAKECLDRARELGSTLPEHYVFPMRDATSRAYDPSRPTTNAWLRRSFGSLREAAGLPWLTPHCFRHQAITMMLENGAAPETVRHIAGHVSEEMMKLYSHSRLETQVTVLRALDSASRSGEKKAGTTRVQQPRLAMRGRRRYQMRRIYA